MMKPWNYRKKLYFISRHFFCANKYSVLINEPRTEEIDKLKEFIKKSNRLICITGAGISTASGIPDYRGPQGSYHKGHKPINHNEFLTNESSRKRYWARSLAGWENLSSAKPNAAHFSLASLETNGILKYIITQNVDNLHRKAGSVKVADIHGNINRVCCQNCNQKSCRNEFQHRLIAANDEFVQHLKYFQLGSANARADGDVELGINEFSQFRVPVCTGCGGILKPDVVMFGDNVPAGTVADLYEKVDQCDSLLIVGTSLEVFSAYRFVNRAEKRKNIPIAIINHGQTRAERQSFSSIVYKSDADCTTLLKNVLNILE